MSNQPDHVLDVAVVGGGVSGLYAAYRLASAGRSVALFEGSDRLGGRLLSVTPPGMTQLVCELGGMFFTGQHRHVGDLARHLELAVDTASVGEQRRILLRGRSLAPADLLNPRKLPYRLARGERRRDPVALLNYALEKLIPELAGKRGDAAIGILAGARVDGRRLVDWGFQNLLYRALSPEGYAYAHDANADDYMVLNWNALDMARTLYEVEASTGLFHVRGGYEQLPAQLGARLRGLGGRLHMRHRLVRIRQAALPDGTSGLRLELEPDGDGWGPGACGDLVVRYARSLVLALPRRALELLERSGPLLDPCNREVHRRIRSVTPMPMFKMFLCYEEPWWQAHGIPGGFSTTDLPLRVCFYWGVEGDQPGADCTNRRALLMATLSDTVYANFWAGMREPRLARPPFSAPDHDRHPGGSPVWWSEAARPTGELVAEAQRQLARLHGVKELPQPYAALYHDWNADPYGGAANFWNIHADSQQLAQAMLQPAPGLPVYICGEAYSHEQGWVEGALATAEQLVQQHFGLAAPAWLSAR